MSVLTSPAAGFAVDWHANLDDYIVDIIAGHCGPRPDWTLIDQTEATARGGAIGRGTLVPYLNAGYPR